MPKIFISYRRSPDTKEAAGRLRDSLVRRFGEQQVFRDIENIQPGDPWWQEVLLALRGDTIVLALIGVGWVTEKDDEGHRLIDRMDKANRLELERALSEQLRTIPVLIDGANMPASRELPEPLRALTGINALLLRDGDWTTDVRKVIARLENYGAKPIKQRNGPVRRHRVWQGVLASGWLVLKALLTSLILSTAVLVAIDILFGWRLDALQTALLVLIVVGLTVLVVRHRYPRRENRSKARL